MKIQNKKKNRGFTLIEMIVVVAIFTILTSVVLFNYSDFNNNILSTNLTYEIALTVREAQVYALGATGVVGATDGFNTRYGAYFNIDLDAVSDNDRYFMLFADKDSNGRCENGCSFQCIAGDPDLDSCREVSRLTRGVFIANLCVANGEPINEDGECTGESVKDLSITFERPNPDAVIATSGYDPGAYTDAAIIVEAPNAARRAVVVRSTGQISVKVINN